MGRDGDGCLIRIGSAQVMVYNAEHEEGERCATEKDVPILSAIQG